MVRYNILERTLKIAKENDLVVKPSKDKIHKIDVYDKNKKFISSIGAINYKDYPTYLQLEQKGDLKKGYANTRKELYKKRHKKDLNTLRGGLSDLLLWT
jgi:hypothetical protein